MQLCLIIESIANLALATLVTSYLVTTLVTTEKAVFFWLTTEKISKLALAILVSTLLVSILISTVKAVFCFPIYLYSSWASVSYFGIQLAGIHIGIH